MAIVTLPHHVPARHRAPGYLSLVFVVLLLAALLAPAGAAERIVELPPIKPWTAARFEAVVVLNDRPQAVARGEVSGPQRGHFVFQFLNPEEPGPRVVEVVAYDRVLYVRTDDNPQWRVTQWGEGGEIPDPAQNILPLGDVRAGIAEFVQSGTLSRIGSMPIGGVPTDQYQVWIPGGQPGVDHIAYDVWIGRQTPYVQQIQFSFFGEVPDMGRIKSELVERFYDFDAAGIVVRPPSGVAKTP